MEPITLTKPEILTFLSENKLYSISRQIDPEKFFRTEDEYLITQDGIYFFFENMATRYRVTFINVEINITANTLHRIVPGRTDKTFKNKNFKRY